ncbi:MAG: hypothetical protein H0T69_01555 [Thermoleophilaceae bacterium]|nr:hypothetical protein [Thermoleophilaceae bacterium]
MAVVWLSGCFGGGDQASPDRDRGTTAERRTTPADDPPPTAALEPARCPPDLANCRTASGRIIYVERVDPDGDGDAHFVLTSRQAITLPGLSVIDVKKSLRPHPLPGPGDRISAAGPVNRGSYGQKQIEAIELHVARAR